MRRHPGCQWTRTATPHHGSFDGRSLCPQCVRSHLSEIHLEVHSPATSQISCGTPSPQKVAVGRRYTKRRRHFHSRLRRRSAGRPPCRDQPEFHAITRGPQIHGLRRQGSRVLVGRTRFGGVRAECGKSRNTSQAPRPRLSPCQTRTHQLPRWARHLGPYCHLERDSQDRFGEEECPGRLRTVETRCGLHHQALGPHCACCGATPLRC